MNQGRKRLSWLDGFLIHLSREFSFAYMATTADRDFASQLPTHTWRGYMYFMQMARRVTCRKPKDGRLDANVPTWDDYFMGMAQLATLRSKDPHTKVFLSSAFANLLANELVIYCTHMCRVFLQ